MKLIIRPIPPFNFDLSALIFSGGDKQIHRYEEGRFWQALRVNGKLILTTVSSVGTVEKPELSVDLNSDWGITSEEASKSEALIRSIFNLDLDLKQFYEYVNVDRKMAEITKALRGLRSPATPTVYEALIDSIIEQQISLNVAHIFETAVTKTFGDALKINSDTYYAFPTPQRLAESTVEDLRRCRLSRRKSEYLIDISKLVASDDLNLERLKEYEDTADIILELDGIRGIGAWTAELTVLRGMHRFDVFPADDVGLRRHIAHYYRNDERISSEEARSIAENWGRWKGLAAFYLIIAHRVLDSMQ